MIADAKRVRSRRQVLPHTSPRRRHTTDDMLETKQTNTAGADGESDNVSSTRLLFTYMLSVSKQQPLLIPFVAPCGEAPTAHLFRSSSSSQGATLYPSPVYHAASSSNDKEFFVAKCGVYRKQKEMKAVPSTFGKHTHTRKVSDGSRTV